jgi:hypothetical protein
MTMLLFRKSTSRRRTYWRLGVAGWLVGILAFDISATEVPLGEEIYRDQCARCHGTSGEGLDDYYPEALVGDRSVGQLATLIAQTMPEDTEEKLPLAEAHEVAAYIYEAFYSPEARERNRPARVELSRLTVRQYHNAVADLIGSFREPSQPGSESGLRGEYFDGRDFRREARKLERTDAEIDFDFGEESPDAEQLKSNDFSIRWSGSLLAPDTGDYEIVLRSEHAVRLWVNDQQDPLIDAWVKSAGDTEHRAEMRLLGGRTYPLKIEFSKSQQGVREEKNKLQEGVPASISLSWKRPHYTLEMIPSRDLITSTGPPVFVVQTPFPPDDRSLGYERGASISKAWDEATTEAAIEIAGYVSVRLAELAGASADDPANEPRLREFCRTFAERAFRRPLTDEQAQLYVDRHFDTADDRLAAIKRSMLLVLKSPRFLYRELKGADESDVHDVAARMSFGLWDSIPDEDLRRAADENQLTGREQISAQLARMLPDPRTRAKLRDFLLNWLGVIEAADLSKDADKYPEFTPNIESDLRTSLELSLDHWLASESADFRSLLLRDEVFLNGALAQVYGVDLPVDAPFQEVSTASGTPRWSVFAPLPAGQSGVHRYELANSSWRVHLTEPVRARIAAPIRISLTTSRRATRRFNHP